MKEIAMSLREIRINFGDSIAEKCRKMNDGDVQEFFTATYEAIMVRCQSDWWTTYYVSGELVLEEALEMDNGMDMGM